jgi:hypothetical protein
MCACAEGAAGHAERSGRYDAWTEESFILAWIVSLVMPDSAGTDVATAV